MDIKAIEEKIALLESQKKEQLSIERGKDLSIVKNLCKKHGFTVKMLKDSLSTGRTRRTREEINAA